MPIKYMQVVIYYFHLKAEIMAVFSYKMISSKSIFGVFYMYLTYIYASSKIFFSFSRLSVRSFNRNGR